MVQEAESGQKRWLLKAVREASGELFSQFNGVGEADLCWRPQPDEWCLKEIAAHLRDAELLYQRQIELIIEEEEPDLPYEPVEVLPAERDYRSEPLWQLLREFEDAREETVWLLRSQDEADWQSRAGIHRYSGRITLYDLAHELHQHDLEHLYQAQRLRQALLVRR